MLNLPKEHISVSQVDMYLRCARQYEFRYIEGLVRPPSVALVYGSSGHSALEFNNSQKIVSKEDLKAEEVVEKFGDEFSDRSAEIGNWEGATKDKVITEGSSLLETYMESTAPEIKPEVVEKEFTVDVGHDEEIPLLGYIDIIQEDGKVGDYKFVGRSKSNADAKNSLQLASYVMVTDADVAEFLCLVKTKVPKVTVVGAMFSQKDLDWARQVIESTARAISGGSFPLCSPGEWCCSERFCGYYRMCRGK